MNGQDDDGLLVSRWKGGDDWIEVTQKRSPWRIKVLLIQFPEGAIHLCGLQIEPKEKGEEYVLSDSSIITTKRLRGLSLPELQKAALGKLGPDPRSHAGLARRTRGQGQGKKNDEALYVAVAQVYMHAQNHLDNPLQAVMKRWGKSRSQASEYIRIARDKHYLPPVTPRKSK